MHKHKLKFLRQSFIFFKGKKFIIDVWKCQICNKYMIIDNATDSQITLNGLIGEEIPLKR